MELPVEEYTNFLKSAMAARSHATNPFSLRAFAGKIGVSPSFFSEVLRGKKQLSAELAFRIALKLDMSDHETQYFCLLVQVAQIRDPALRQEAIGRLASFCRKRGPEDLSLEIFKVISQWYHFAILELSFLPDFDFCPRYIVRRLGIGQAEARVAMQRLEQLELIKRDPKSGRYRKTAGYLLTESNIPSGELKAFHKQILEKVLAAIDSTPPSERVTATDLLPLDAKYLKEVDRLSREFTESVLRMARKSRAPAGVYALAVHLTRLSR